MGRRYVDSVWIGQEPNRFAVGYSTKDRSEETGKARCDYLKLCFLDANGKRIERATSWPVKKRIDANFQVEAARIILKAYATVYVMNDTWEDALKALSADLRPDTLTAYQKAVRILRETLEENKLTPKGPSQITAETAALFAQRWLAGTYKRSNASDAKTYKRKPTTLAFYLRQLSAVWAQWQPLGYVKSNVWKEVRKPKLDKVVKHVPTEDEAAHFFQWIHTRYPQWERLHAFLDLKAVSACRSQDICQLRSDQVKDGRVTWTAEQVKQRQGRAVKVPADLYASLVKLAGPVYLWEGFIDDLRRFRGNPSKLKGFEFSPETVAHVVGNIFREYSDEHPTRPRLSPHALRRRGITLSVQATQSVDAASQAIGVTPQTVKAAYLNAERAFNADALFDKLGGVLRLPKATTQAEWDAEAPPESPPTILPLSTDKEGTVVASNDNQKATKRRKS